MVNVKKILKVFAILIVIILLVLMSLLWFMPLAWLTPLMDDKKITLINPQNSIKQGSIDGIQFKGNEYSLLCNYARTSMIPTVTYDVTCSSPITISGSIEITYSKQINVRKAKITGNLSKLQPWFRYTQKPLIISGNLDLNIDKLSFKEQTIINIDINGSINNLRLYYLIGFNDFTITSLQPQLINKTPIQLSLKTQNISNEDNITLDLLIKTDGKKSITFGKVSGNILSKFKNVLTQFGKEIDSNSYYISIAKRLL